MKNDRLEALFLPVSQPMESLMTCPPHFEALVDQARALARELTGASQPVKVRLAGIILSALAVSLENRSLERILDLIRAIPVSSSSAFHEERRAVRDVIRAFQEMEIVSLRLFDPASTLAEDFADALSALERVLRAGKRNALEKLSELCLMDRVFT